MMAFSFPSLGKTSAASTQGAAFDWEPVIKAIIQVESEGNPKAVNANSAGILQITPIMVKDCNKILKKRNSKKRFSLSDRFDVAKSKEMFRLYQSHYNKTNDVEWAIRAWNGGLHFRKRSTQRYYEKVKRNM